MGITPLGPAKRTKVPGNKDQHPLSESTVAGGRETREFLVPYPLLEPCKGMIDPVISQRADGETFMLSHHKLLLREICSWDVGFARRSSEHKLER